MYFIIFDKILINKATNLNKFSIQIITDEISISKNLNIYLFYFKEKVKTI